MGDATMAQRTNNLKEKIFKIELNFNLIELTAEEAVSVRCCWRFGWLVAWILVGEVRRELTDIIAAFQVGNDRRFVHLKLQLLPVQLLEEAMLFEILGVVAGAEPLTR